MLAVHLFFDFVRFAQYGWEQKSLLCPSPQVLDVPLHVATL
jgi:hypothetical protein